MLHLLPRLIDRTYASFNIGNNHHPFRTHYTIHMLECICLHVPNPLFWFWSHVFCTSYANKNFPSMSIFLCIIYFFVWLLLNKYSFHFLSFFWEIHVQYYTNDIPRIKSNNVIYQILQKVFENLTKRCCTVFSACKSWAWVSIIFQTDISDFLKICNKNL